MSNSISEGLGIRSSKDLESLDPERLVKLALGLGCSFELSPKGLGFSLGPVVVLDEVLSVWFARMVARQRRAIVKSLRRTPRKTKGESARTANSTKTA